MWSTLHSTKLSLSWKVESNRLIKKSSAFYGSRIRHSCPEITVWHCIVWVNDSVIEYTVIKKQVTTWRLRELVELGWYLVIFLDLEMLRGKIFKKYATLPKVKFCRMGKKQGCRATIFFSFLFNVRYTNHWITAGRHVKFSCTYSQLSAQLFLVWWYFFSLYISSDYVPIIRRNNCIYVTLGICHSVWMTVWYAGWNSALHTIQNNKYQVSHRYSCFSWWCAHSRPKRVQKRNKYTKKNCAPSWLYLQDYRRMHGQQNIKNRVKFVTDIVRI